ncbi:hypothetical protein [Aquimonas voraii]|nr:hypothetical protein [Aquimonas voraii]
MLGEAAHARISALSEAHDLSQPDVIDALLDAVDREALAASVERLLRRRQANRDQLSQKRKLLEEASAHMTADQIEALIAVLKSKGFGEQSQG